MRGLKTPNTSSTIKPSGAGGVRPSTPQGSGAAGSFPSQYCVCGRPREIAMPRSPREAELRQLLRNVSEERVSLAAQGKLTADRAARLASEEHDLRQELAHHVHRDD